MAMNLKKSCGLACLSALLVSFLSAQSVTDLAKKEKERRAAVKNKPATIVTNADLEKVKKKPAVQVAEQEKTGAEGQAAEEAGQPGTQPATTQAAETKAPQQPPPVDRAAMAEKDFKARLNDLATKLQQAQEMIDLLTLKMNSLWQEFYNLSDVKSREYTQFQISETYDKLTKAEAEAARAKKELDDFLATAKREGVPDIWIK